MSHKQISGSLISMLEDDVDTDRIIPARFLKCVTFDKLGQGVFYDERFDSQGNCKPHAFHENPQGTILLTGNNFGCGSSREHAPQALKRYGIAAIIGISFAEIFYGNSVAIGLPCFKISRKDSSDLEKCLAKNSGAQGLLSIEDLTITIGESVFILAIEAAHQKAFLHQRFDSLDVLLSSKEKVQKKYQELFDLGLV